MLFQLSNEEHKNDHENIIEEPLLSDHQNAYQDTLIDAALFALVTLYTIICPYTKVEESFHIQATHDILIHGPFNITNYDHFTFPGAVPRSFIPSLLLSIISSILIIPLYHIFHLITKFQIQITIRIILGLTFVLSLRELRKSISIRFGRDVSRCFGLICLTEFHLVFYASRTLSNTFAMILSNHALALWIGDVEDNENYSKNSSSLTKANSGNENTKLLLSSSKIHDNVTITIQFLIFTAAILRAEILLFLFSFLFTESLIFQQIPFTFSTIWSIFQTGYRTSLISIAMSISVDMYFWEQFVWSEANSFVFNIVQGKSSEWGIEPFWNYWVKYLPKLAPIALPLATLGLVISNKENSIIKRGVLRYLAPAFIYITVYSILPHKEWRFIIYIIPLVNLAAGVGLVQTSKFTKHMNLYYLPQIILLLSGMTISFFQVYISSLNYPGGVALSRFHQIIPNNKTIYVHMDVHTCMTGATLFGQENDNTVMGWKYSKNETHILPEEYKIYTHLITENPDFHMNGIIKWEIIDTTSGYAEIKILNPREWVRNLLGNRWKRWDWRPEMFKFGVVDLPVEVHLKPLLYTLSCVI